VRRVTMVAAALAALAALLALVAALMMTAGIALAESFRGDDYGDVQGDGRADEVSCGSGRDVVRANPEDHLSDDCEVAKGVAGPK